MTSKQRIPALIDPHVHFRVPGQEWKEDWKSGALAAIRGGVTTVFDMPNNVPPCLTVEDLRTKKAVIDAQLKAVDIPLRYGLYLGADKRHLSEIEKASGEAIGVKVFMGCSTGNLVVDTKEALDEAFRRAASVDLLVAVHAEDEATLLRLKRDGTDPALHSQVRGREAAIVATAQALELAAKHGTKLYIVHLSTKEELELVRAAKASGVRVFAEATPNHLFLSEADYAQWGTRVQVNPPLRTLEDQEALWEGIRDGTFDTLGTDHAPHTLQEKSLPYGKAPSGIPGVETLLPLMLNAVNEKRLTLERFVELSHTNIVQIFDLEPFDDEVEIDLSLTQEVDAARLASKSGWTPYAGLPLTGWPVATILKGRRYPIRETIEETQPGFSDATLAASR